MRSLEALQNIGELILCHLQISPIVNFRNQYHHINSDMTEMLKKVVIFCNRYLSYGALTDQYKYYQDHRQL